MGCEAIEEAWPVDWICWTGGMDIEEWEAEPGGGGGVRLVVWARSGDGDWKLALELRFVRPSLFLKRALKELMNNKPEGGRETLKEKEKKKRKKGDKKNYSMEKGRGAR